MVVVVVAGFGLRSNGRGSSGGGLEPRRCAAMFAPGVTVVAHPPTRSRGRPLLVVTANGIAGGRATRLRPSSADPPLGPATRQGPRRGADSLPHTRLRCGQPERGALPPFLELGQRDYCGLLPDCLPVSEPSLRRTWTAGWLQVLGRRGCAWLAQTATVAGGVCLSRTPPSCGSSQRGNRMWLQ
jgi:hypothetical protein